MTLMKLCHHGIVPVQYHYDIGDVTDSYRCQEKRWHLQSYEYGVTLNEQIGIMK